MCLGRVILSFGFSYEVSSQTFGRLDTQQMRWVQRKQTFFRIQALVVMMIVIAYHLADEKSW